MKVLILLVSLFATLSRCTPSYKFDESESSATVRSNIEAILRSNIRFFSDTTITVGNRVKLPSNLYTDTCLVCMSAGGISRKVSTHTEIVNSHDDCNRLMFDYDDFRVVKSGIAETLVIDGVTFELSMYERASDKIKGYRIIDASVTVGELNLVQMLYERYMN